MYKQRIDQMIEEIKSSPATEGVEEVLVPGEIENSTEKTRLENGVDIDEEMYKVLKQVGKDIEDYKSLHITM